MTWEEREQFYFRRFRNNPNRIDQEPTLLATARAICLEGTDALRTHTSPFTYWEPLSRRDVPTYGEIRWRGGVRAVRERITRGGLGIEEQLLPWSGGFWKGLILSGALRVQSLASWGRYQIWVDRHTALVRDIEQASVAKHFEMTTGKSGCRRLSKTPSTVLPSQDDAEVMGGLFAGALLEVDPEKDNWLILPGSEEVKAMLKRMTILFRPWRSFRSQERIAVSPFYALLFASRMPHESAKRIRGIRRPAQAETLSLLYWEAYFASTGQPIPPFADALPFAVAPRTFRRRGYNRRDLHKQAVMECGILSLAKPLRTAMEAWVQEASCPSLVKARVVRRVLV